MVFKVLGYAVTITLICVALSTIDSNPFRSAVFMLWAILIEIAKVNIKLERLNGKVPVIRMWEKQGEADRSAGKG